MIPKAFSVVVILMVAVLLLAACQPPVQAPTSTSTPAFLLPPTPTIFMGLLQRLPAGSIPPLPGGLAMDLYQMASAPFPDEGYEPVIRSLGEGSRLHLLTQGRYYWDTADLALMEADNGVLAPFGYHLASKPVDITSGARWFTLYQGEKVVIDPITSLGEVSVNRSGTDFLLLVGGTSQFLLVGKDSLEPWSFMNGTIASSRPQFLDDDVMHVEIRAGQRADVSETPAPKQSTAVVLRNGQAIYTTHYQDRPAGSGFIGFWTYGDHWAMETLDRVVIDGQEVGLLNGYERSYEFHLLGGTPLFFFEKSGRLNVSFDGESFPLPFPAIPHYGCCSASAENPVQVGDVLIFYGVQGEKWYYVEMGI